MAESAGNEESGRSRQTGDSVIRARVGGNEAGRSATTEVAEIYQVFLR